MRNKSILSNIIIDSNYPYGRLKDNTGAGDGTPVNEFVYGDIHQFFAKLITLAGIVPNDLPDNEINQYQTIQALKEFASKNNYIHNLSSVSGVLNVSAKLGLMNNEEFLICKASSNLGLETQIKGTDGATFTITAIGSFKTNEYVRLIKTATTIVLVRISDGVSLDLMISELLYLKKASQSEENAGVIDTKGTTPLVNKVTFTRRVIGADSGSYLATSLANGLYPKEHFSIVAGLGTNPVRNTGWFSGLDINGINGLLPVSGDIVSANHTLLGINSLGHGSSKILVTLSNAMTNTNYIVKMYIQSQSSNIATDLRVCYPVFKPLTTTTFEVGMGETQGLVDSLKVHIEVVQL